MITVTSPRDLKLYVTHKPFDADMTNPNPDADSWITMTRLLNVRASDRIRATSRNRGVTLTTKGDGVFARE